MSESESPSPTSAGSDDRPKRKHPVLRWGVRVALVVLLVVAVVIVFLPGILSGGWAKGRLTEAVNNSIAGTATIESISLSWFGEQRVAGVVLRDPDGEAVASVDGLTISGSLWSLAIGGRDVGRIVIEGLEGRYVTPPEGPSNIERAVEPRREPPRGDEPESTPDGPFRLPVAFKLEVVDARLTVVEPDQPEMRLGLSSLILDASRPGEPITFDVDGAVERGAHRGTLGGAGKLTGYAADRTLRTADARLDGKLNIAGLPVEAIDAVAGLDGLALAAIDGPLSLTVQAEGPLDGEQVLTLTGDADNIEQLDLTGTLADDQFSVRGDVRVVARPELVAWINRRSDQFGGRLAAGVPVTLAIERMVTPTAGFRPAATRLDAALTVEPGELVGDERIGDLAWRTVEATINTENLADALRVELKETRLTVRGKSGRISAHADLAKLFDARGEPTLDRMAVNGEARVIGLPMGLVDLLAGMDGLAVAAIDGPLDLDATFAGTAGGEQTFTLTADAANIDAFRLNGARRDDRLSLDGEVKLTARPELVALLAERAEGFAGRLEAGVPLTLTIDRGATAMAGFDPAATSFDLALGVGAGSLGGDRRLGDLAWQPAELRLTTDNLADALRVRLPKTPIIVRGKSGHVLARLALSDLFDEAGAFRDDAVAIDGRIEAVGLPPTVVDAIAGLEGWATDAMGSVSITADVKGSAAEHIDADLEVADGADAMRRATVPLRIGERITLQPEQRGTLTYMPTDAIAAKLVPAEYARALRFGRPIELTIASLDAPGLGADFGELTPAQVRLGGVLTLREVGGTVMLEGADGPTDKLAVPEAVVELGGESLAAPTFTLDAAIEASGKGPASTYLGGRTRFEATGSTTLDERFAPGAARLDILAENASGRPQPLERLAAVIETDAKMQRVRLVDKAELKYRVGPAMIAAGEGEPTLADPALATVTLDQLDAPLAADALGSIKAVGSFKLDDATLAGQPRLTGAKLAGLTGSVNVDGPGDTLAGELNGRLIPATAGASPATLAATLNLRRWQRDGKLDLAKAAGEATVELKGIAARDAEALALATGLIEPFTGDRLDLRVTAVLDPEAPAPFGLPVKTLDLALDSPKLSMTPKVRVGDKVAELVDPIDAELSISPDEYAGLVRALGADDAVGQWALTESLRPKLTLKTLRLPVPTPGEGPYLDLGRVALESSFDLPRLATRDRQRDVVTTFVDVHGEITTEDPTKRLKLAMTGRTPTEDAVDADAGARDDLNVNVDLVQLFDASGKLTKQQMRAVIDARLKALPVAMIDALTGSEGRLLAAFGHQATLTGDARLERFTGPVNLRVDATHAVARLDGRVTDGVLRLKKPLAAEFTVTEALGRKLLSNVHPLLRTVYTGEEPIKLTIDPGPDGEGFVLPLTDFDLRRARIDRAVLDLGKLKAKPGPLLKGLNRLAGRNRGGDSSLWFSPLRFSIKDGRIAYDRRLDLLIDGSFHVASWGEVRLMEPAKGGGVSLDLFFGFPAQTLDDVFGLDNASPKDMFTVPLKGTVENPSIDFGKAAANMGRLQAQYKLIDNPLARAAIGKLIDRLLRPEGEADPPRQSVSPLPWKKQGPAAEPDADNAEQTEPADQPDDAEPPADETDGDAARQEQDEEEDRRPNVGDIIGDILR